jgi:NAD(P)-dependent dehydrogenase (short-subunit alcohol dehydrogenase family)
LESALKKWAELENMTLEQVQALRLKEIPLGRFIQPQDMAQLAVFLCSDSAQAITGQAIAVDGGSGRAIPY